MPSILIQNPNGAYGLTPTLDAFILEAKSTEATALPRGTVVVIAYSVTTGAVTCAKAGTAEDLDFVFGVTQEAIGIGKTGAVCIRGFTYVKVGAGTVANGDEMIRSSTVAGEAEPLTSVAATIVGQVMGTFIGAKGSADPYPFANAAPCLIGKM